MLTGSQILANAVELANSIRELNLAAQYDDDRCLPADIVEDLRAAGVFRMAMPSIWGGPETTSMEQVEVVEALSRADASVGWCSFIWMDSGLYSGYLDDAVAREMYPRLDMATSGWVYPSARARRVNGGFDVSARWMFGSGCDHCDWLVGGCVVVGADGKPEHNDDGTPVWRILMAPREQYRIEDTWYTTGLRGTGSKHYSCEDLFVPEEHTFSFFDAKREGPLWRRPDALLRKMAGVPLGIAGDALDTAIEILEAKTDRMMQVPYRDMQRVQTAIADARLQYAAARSYVFSSLETQWARLERNEDPTPEERADVWLARTNAFQAARRVVQNLYDTVGATSIYANEGPFDRHLRDIQTACQHIAGQVKGTESVGALLLGSDRAAQLL